MPGGEECKNLELASPFFEYEKQHFELPQRYKSTRSDKVILKLIETVLLRAKKRYRPRLTKEQRAERDERKAAREAAYKAAHARLYATASV